MRQALQFTPIFLVVHKYLPPSSRLFATSTALAVISRRKKKSDHEGADFPRFHGDLKKKKKKKEKERKRSGEEKFSASWTNLQYNNKTLMVLRFCTIDK